jgi:V/A-type H+-transporting ATPase subunit G/H
MSIEILQEIVSVENQAEQVEAQAQQRARDIIAAAKKDASVLVEKAVEQAEKEAKDIIKLVEVKASKDIENMKLATQNKCVEIKENSGKRLEKAIDFIMGRIVDSSDR